MQANAPPRRRTKRTGSSPQNLQSINQIVEALQPRPRRRRSKKSLSIEGARLEHLVCCYNNDRFQGDLKVAEEHCEEQVKDLMELHRIRAEEVVLLSQEARDLRKMLGSAEDDILSSDATAWNLLFPPDKLAAGGTAVHSRRADVAEDLQASRKQVDLRKMELAAVRHRVKEAQKEAVLHRAKLSVTREVREMEVHELREMLATSTQEQKSDTEEGLLRCLSFEQLTAKEVCKLSELEKLEHQKQVTSLYLQLQKARGADEMEIDGVDGKKAGSLEDALQALQTPAEALLSFLEEETGAAKSTTEEGSSWMQELTQRLDSCCSMLPR